MQGEQKEILKLWSSYRFRIYLFIYKCNTAKYIMVM